MDKNFLRDVIPPTHTQKKSIRNIPLSENATRKLERDAETEDRLPPRRPQQPLKETQFRNMPSRNPWKKILIIIVIIAAIGYVGFGMSNARATITLTPESAERSIDLAFNVFNPSIAIFEEGFDTSLYIPFSVEEISVTQSKNVPASGEEEVEDKSQGTLTVFNDSDEPQLLITNTRFESTDGKIYRIQKAITVPSKTEGQPGQLDVVVLADVPGVEYDRDEVGASFTIPGLKDTPQFTTMYAKSKTSITGGFAGVRKVVSEEDAEMTRTELQTDLIESIKEKVASSNTDATFVMYNPEFITYSSLTDTVSGESVTLSEKATVTALVFDRAVISNKLAQGALRSDATADIKVENLNQLTISFEDASNFDPAAMAEGIIRVSGDAEFVWNIKEDALKEEFKGMSKADLTQKLSETAGVSRAKIAITPFWKQSAPQNSDKIDIVIEKEEGNTQE